MWLGIDLGTSRVKVVVLDETQHVAAEATAPLEVSRPQPGWSEQAPEAWWRATGEAVLSIHRDIRRAVRAIGLSGQMHGATLLDASDEVLRPAILWNDGRSRMQCLAFETAAPRLRSITGNVAMPGFTAPKLLWVRDNEPDTFARVTKILLPKDYVRLRMTGECASDMSDSAGTLWLDVAARCWNDELLRACDLDQSHMPTLYEGPDLTGVLRAEVAEAWGMSRVGVVASAGDNAAGAIGVGVIANGDGVLSLGTSGTIFVANDVYRPIAERGVHTFCHAVPGMWHQMSVHLSAASCIDWVQRLTGLASPADVFDVAEANGAALGQELFLPYLSGERTPHNDPDARGGFLNLDHDTGPAQLCAAVLEGVAFALADGVEALRLSGARLDELSVVGGGSRSVSWVRIIASALDAKLVLRRGGEVGPATGAARLAYIGDTGADLAAVCVKPEVSQVVVPDAAIRARILPKLEKFRAAYARLRSTERGA